MDTSSSEATGASRPLSSSIFGGTQAMIRLASPAAASLTTPTAASELRKVKILSSAVLREDEYDAAAPGRPDTI